MKLNQNLSKAFRIFVQNPSLFGIALSEMVLLYFIGVLFFLGDMAILFALNRDSLANVPLQNIDAALTAFMNPTTIAVFLILLFVQGVALLLLDSFFKSGLYGMMKNALYDGSTGLAEFVPEAKRFWPPMLRFLFIKYALSLLIFIPFGIVMFRLAVTPQIAISDSLIMSALISMAVFFLLLALISFLFLYGEAAVVLGRMSALEGIKSSVETIKENFLPSVLLALLLVGLFFGILLFESIAATPINIQLQSSDALNADSASLWSVARMTLSFFSNLLVLSLTVVSGLLIFLSYATFAKIRIQSTAASEGPASPSPAKRKKTSKK